MRKRLDDAPYGRRSIALPLIDRVAVGEQALTITINAPALGRRLRLDLDKRPPIELAAPAVRFGRARRPSSWLAIRGTRCSRPIATWSRCSRTPRRAQAAVVAAPECSIKEIAPA